MNLSEVTHRADDAAAVAVAAAAATLETVESFGIGYGQGAGASTSDWMKPPGDLFLYSTLDMKDLTGAVGDMVFICLFVCKRCRITIWLRYACCDSIASKPRPPRDVPGGVVAYSY